MFESKNRYIKDLSVSIFIGTWVICSFLFSSCRPEENPQQQTEYQIQSLDLGIAYPPVRNEIEIKRSIGYLHDLGIKRIRISDSWQLREPQEGEYEWAPLDKRLTLFHEAGIKVLLTIESSWPAWLGGSENHTDRNSLDKFREYVSELLLRYSDKIDRIQYGNEWNWSIDDYFGGDKDAYISYNNILYEEVQKIQQSVRPPVVLGSSVGIFLAADQGLVDQYIIEGTPVYTAQTEAYLALPPDKRFTPTATDIFTNAFYDMIDIHVYDNYEAWPFFIEAFLSCHKSCKGQNVPLIASEFGGPYAKDLYNIFGKPSPDLLAKRVSDYIKILDESPVVEAYFFKLVEGGNATYHQDSYLLNSELIKMPAYKVLKNIKK